MKIYNHIAPRFSEIETEMVKHIPPGGNWKNIPDTIPSKRLEQIRRSGGRTTYYGRLVYDKPSYTISTYFNRIGNGCFIHPAQSRLISIREAARLQSFKDSFIFYGSKTSTYKQVGNAVPPFLARAIAELLEPFVDDKTFIDLFAGAGGMSQGFILQGFKLSGAIEIEKNFFETFTKNHEDQIHNKDFFIEDDIRILQIKKRIGAIKKEMDIEVIIGGPPCQGFSLAGWRDEKDKRNQLFKDFLWIVKELRPKFFVMENVPGILTMKKGKVMDEILNSFKRIGYFVNDPIMLKAEEFGVPQLRRRVFVIGSLEEIKLLPPRPLFSFENPSLPKPITVKMAIGNLPPLKPGEGEFVSDAKLKPTSKYEELMMDMTNFKEFYGFMKKIS